MNSYSFTLLFLLAFSQTMSQITITANDMPNPNDTFRISQAINFAGDPSQTGPDFFWNYADLSPQTQTIDTFLSVNSTPWEYQLIFNLPFDPEKATGAYKISTPPFSLPSVTISDTYEFFRESNTEFSRVGFGARISSIPIPVKFSDPEKNFVFPLSYQNTFSSFSEYNLEIPTLGYFGQAIQRNSVVDGWGTLSLPSGNYPVLRVKAVLNKTDTISYSGSGFGFSFPEPESTEYLWVSQGIGTILLRISSNGINNTLSYYDPIQPDTSSNGFSTFKPEPFRIFPNPATDRITIEGSGFSTTGTRVTWSDVQGKTLGTITTPALPFSLPVEGWTPGIYLIHIQSDSHSYFQKVLIQP